MEITWRPEKERTNIRKHGFDFSLARQVLANPLSDTRWNGAVNGGERWLTIGNAEMAGQFKTVVIIHTYPDPDDEAWVHVISLREAPAHERRRYEISRL